MAEGSGAGQAGQGATELIGQILGYLSAQDWRRQSYQSSASSIVATLRENYRAFQERAGQESVAFMNATDKLARQSEAMVSAHIAGGADRGVGGQAALAGIQDLRRTKLEQTHFAHLNYKFSLRQLQREAEAAQTNAYQQLLSAIGSPIPAPDYLGGVAQIGAGLAAL